MMWENLTKCLYDFGNELVEKYLQDLTTNDAIASWNLFDSVRYQVKYDSAGIEVDLSLADYWKYVENGRKAGKFPPIENIRKWVEVKPVLPYPDSNGKLPTTDQLAFLIARKISNEGTDGKHILENSVNETIARFNDEIEEAISKDIDDGFTLIIQGIFR